MADHKGLAWMAAEIRAGREVDSSYIDAVEYICEWCEPSSVPEDRPESCLIRRCEVHGRCWHWPRELEEPRG